MLDIPNQVTQILQTENQIPNKAAELPQDSEAPEIRPYLISFAKYNEKMCEIPLLNSNKAKKAVITFKTIGTKVKSQADFQRYSIDRIPIENKGDYKRLYNGLSGDIQVKEIKLQQDARIFYFDIEPERTLYIIAITENHLETDKVRR